MTSADDREDRTPQPPGLAASAMDLLSRQAARMPLVAVTLGLQAWERTRGVRELAMRRGGEVLQIAAHTPLGRFLPQPVFEDGAQAEADEIAASAARASASKAGGAATKAAPRGTGAAAQAAKTAAVAAPKRATGSATSAATKTSTDKSAAGKAAAAKRAAAAPATAAAAEPPAEAVAAGAPGVATEQVERLTEQLDLTAPESREELPIPDFDNISLGSLRARLRSLDLPQLVLLREWEQAHAHRLPVITLLDNRIAKVADEQPTGSASATYPGEGGGSTGTGGNRPSRSAPAAGARAAQQARQAAQDEGGTLRV